MRWQITIIQSVVITCLSCLIIYSLTLDTLNSNQMLLEGFKTNLNTMSGRLTNIDQQVKYLKDNLPPREDRSVNVSKNQIPVSLTQKNEPVQSQKAQNHALHIQLQSLEERVGELRQTMLSLISQQETIGKLQKEYLPEPVRVRNWLTQLPPDKKEQVQEVYIEQQKKMLNTFSASPDVIPPSPEEMHSLLLESRQGLKKNLKILLNHEEYQAFLDSLDQTDLPHPVMLQ